MSVSICRCLYVPLSVCEHISKPRYSNYIKFFVHVSCGCVYESVTVKICLFCAKGNANNATAFGIWFDDKLCEVMQQMTSTVLVTSWRLKIYRVGQKSEATNSCGLLVIGKKSSFSTFVHHHHHHRHHFFHHDFFNKHS